MRRRTENGKTARKKAESDELDEQGRKNVGRELGKEEGGRLRT